jgi:putative endonuclease
MASLYILQSETSSRYYIGSTTDLQRRLSEHQRQQTPSTRGRGPWKLVYREDFETSVEAHRRELEIKRWKSAKLIRELICRSAAG